MAKTPVEESFISQKFIYSFVQGYHDTKIPATCGNDHAHGKADMTEITKVNNVIFEEEACQSSGIRSVEIEYQNSSNVCSNQIIVGPHNAKLAEQEYGGVASEHISSIDSQDCRKYRKSITRKKCSSQRDVNTDVEESNSSSLDGLVPEQDETKEEQQATSDINSDLVLNHFRAKELLIAFDENDRVFRFDEQHIKRMHQLEEWISEQSTESEENFVGDENSTRESQDNISEQENPTNRDVQLQHVESIPLSEHKLEVEHLERQINNKEEMIENLMETLDQEEKNSELHKQNIFDLELKNKEIMLSNKGLEEDIKHYSITLTEQDKEISSLKEVIKSERQLRERINISFTEFKKSSINEREELLQKVQILEVKISKLKQYTKKLKMNTYQEPMMQQSNMEQTEMHASRGCNDTSLDDHNFIQEFVDHGFDFNSEKNNLMEIVISIVEENDTLKIEIEKLKEESRSYIDQLKHEITGMKLKYEEVAEEMALGSVEILGLKDTIKKLKHSTAEREGAKLSNNVSILRNNIDDLLNDLANSRLDARYIKNGKKFDADIMNNDTNTDYVDSMNEVHQFPKQSSPRADYLLKLEQEQNIELNKKLYETFKLYDETYEQLQILQKSCQTFREGNASLKQDIESFVSVLESLEKDKISFKTSVEMHLKPIIQDHLQLISVLGHCENCHMFQGECLKNLTKIDALLHSCKDGNISVDIDISNILDTEALVLDAKEKIENTNEHPNTCISDSNELQDTDEKTETVCSSLEHGNQILPNNFLSGIPPSEEENILHACFEKDVGYNDMEVFQNDQADPCTSSLENPLHDNDSDEYILLDKAVIFLNEFQVRYLRTANKTDSVPAETLKKEDETKIDQLPSISTAYKLGCYCFLTLIIYYTATIVFNISAAHLPIILVLTFITSIAIYNDRKSILLMLQNNIAKVKLLHKEIKAIEKHSNHQMEFTELYAIIEKQEYVLEQQKDAISAIDKQLKLEQKKRKQRKQVAVENNETTLSVIENNLYQGNEIPTSSAYNAGLFLFAWLILLYTNVTGNLTFITSCIVLSISFLFLHHKQDEQKVDNTNRMKTMFISVLVTLTLFLVVSNNSKNEDWTSIVMELAFCSFAGTLSFLSSLYQSTNKLITKQLSVELKERTYIENVLHETEQNVDLLKKLLTVERSTKGTLGSVPILNREDIDTIEAFVDKLDVERKENANLQFELKISNADNLRSIQMIKSLSDKMSYLLKQINIMKGVNMDLRRELFNEEIKTLSYRDELKQRENNDCRSFQMSNDSHSLATEFNDQNLSLLAEIADVENAKDTDYKKDENAVNTAIVTWNHEITNEGIETVTDLSDCVENVQDMHGNENENFSSFHSHSESFESLDDQYSNDYPDGLQPHQDRINTGYKRKVIMRANVNLDLKHRSDSVLQQRMQKKGCSGRRPISVSDNMNDNKPEHESKRSVNDYLNETETEIKFPEVSNEDFEALNLPTFSGQNSDDSGIDTPENAINIDRGQTLFTQDSSSQTELQDISTVQMNVSINKEWISEVRNELKLFEEAVGIEAENIGGNEEQEFDAILEKLKNIREFIFSEIKDLRSYSQRDQQENMMLQQHVERLNEKLINLQSIKKEYIKCNNSSQEHLNFSEKEVPISEASTTDFKMESLQNKFTKCNGKCQDLFRYFKENIDELEARLRNEKLVRKRMISEYETELSTLETVITTKFKKVNSVITMLEQCVKEKNWLKFEKVKSTALENISDVNLNQEDILLQEIKELKSIIAQLEKKLSLITLQQFRPESKVEDAGIVPAIQSNKDMLMTDQINLNRFAASQAHVTEETSITAHVVGIEENKNEETARLQQHVTDLITEVTRLKDNDLSRKRIECHATIYRSSAGYGTADHIMNAELVPVSTSNEEDSWISIVYEDGISVLAKAYCLRHGWITDDHYLTNWVLEGSNDMKNWVTLKTHINDESLKGRYAKHTWNLENNSKTYHAFRIRMTSTNSTGTNEIFVNAFKIYGATILLD